MSLWNLRTAFAGPRGAVGSASDSRASGSGFDPVRSHTSVCPSAGSRRAVVISYWRKYVHEVLVNCLGGLSLPRMIVVRLTDHPGMPLS